MSVLFITIGQRDVQYVKNINDKYFSYPFNNKDGEIISIQKKLENKKTEINWIPFIKNNIVEENAFISEKDINWNEKIYITFPLIERVIDKLKKDIKNKKNWNELTNIFLFFTDRSEIREKNNNEQKKYLLSEPYYFNEIIKIFSDKINS